MPEVPNEPGPGFFSRRQPAQHLVQLRGQQFSKWLAFRCFDVGCQVPGFFGQFPDSVQQYCLAHAPQSQQHLRPGGAPVQGTLKRHACIMDDVLPSGQFRWLAAGTGGKRVSDGVHG